MCPCCGIFRIPFQPLKKTTKDKPEKRGPITSNCAHQPSSCRQNFQISCLSSAVAGHGSPITYQVKSTLVDGQIIRPPGSCVIFRTKWRWSEIKQLTCRDSSEVNTSKLNKLQFVWQIYLLCWKVEKTSINNHPVFSVVLSIGTVFQIEIVPPFQNNDIFTIMFCRHFCFKI